MKKSFKNYAICWAILFVVFNVVVFAIPANITGINIITGSFWIGYALTALSFIGHIACAYFAFKEENRRKLFYNYSLISISIGATIFSVIVGTAFIVIPFLPYWIGIIICALTLGANAIAIITAKSAVDFIGNIDETIKSKTSFMKLLAIDLNGLVMSAKSDVIQEKIRKVYDIALYSDPMSCDALADTEAQLSAKFNELAKAVAANDIENASILSDEMMVLLNTRNEKCRLFK